MTSSTRTRTRAFAALVATTIATATAVVGVLPATGATAAAPAVTAGPARAATVAPDGVYAFDTFERTSTSGWGSSTVGGAWTTTGGRAGDFTVDGAGTAQMNVRGVGRHLNAALKGVSSTSTEVRTRVALAARPVGGNVDVEVLTRAVATEDAGYLARLRFYPDGTVGVSLVRTSNGRATTLHAVDVPNLRYTDGMVLQVRAQTAGVGGVTHRAKVWPVGSPEPSSWTATVTDDNGGRAAGSVGVRAYTGWGLRNAPATVRVTGFAAGPLDGTPDAVDYAPPSRPEIGTYIPDATNTGVPAGTPLTVHQGDLRITEPGTVVDGLDVRGVVYVDALDVVIRNSIIRGRAANKQEALVLVALPSERVPTGGSALVEDSELYNSSPGSWVDGVRGANFTLRRVNVHHVIDMVHIYGANVTVEGSYLHDNLHYENDPAQGGNPTHDDSIQIQVGSNIRIFGNNISGAYNTGIQFTQDRGIVSDVVIDRNLLDGGGCMINLAEKGRGPFQGIVIRDNTFGRNMRLANCAIISPPTTILTTANNYFTDGGVVTVRRGQ